MRWLLAMALAVIAGSGSAQEPGRIFRLGVLAPSEASIASIRQHTLPELARRGFIEGRNLVVEERSGVEKRLAELARDLVGSRPDVVIAVSETAIRPILEADLALPVVMSFIGGDPVEAGLAASISRPGGRVTGLMMLAHQLDPKRLEVLHEVLPTVKRVAVLRGRSPRHDRNLKDLPRRAEQLGLELHFFYADDQADYALAFAGMREARAEALLIPSAPDFARDAALLSSAATQIGVPAICEWDYMARQGCLLSYGPVQAELRRRTAAYVSQILRGVPAGELPIEGPVNFEVLVNLRTARALGLTVPPTVLARADEVIE